MKASALTCLATVTTFATPVLAQTAPSAPVAPTALLLPGDELPPPLERMIAPPRPSSAPRPPQPVPPVGPPLPLAMEAAQAALAQCRTLGLKAGVAVSDSGGNVILGLTDPGANPGRIFVGARKNLLAIAAGTPSSVVKTRLQANDAAAHALLKPNMMAWGGAVPLVSGGKVVGAIGASGGSQAQDEECAVAGANAIKAKL